MALSAAQIAAVAAAEARLALYLQAEADVLRNQSYEMPDGRKLTRADLAPIRAGIAEIRKEIANVTGVVTVRGRTRRGVIFG